MNPYIFSAIIAIVCTALIFLYNTLQKKKSERVISYAIKICKLSNAAAKCDNEEEAIKVLFLLRLIKLEFPEKAFTDVADEIILDLMKKIIDTKFKTIYK